MPIIRGSPVQVHELSSNERKICSKVLFERAELFEQFVQNELNWSNSSCERAELFEQFVQNELNWWNSSFERTE